MPARDQYLSWRLEFFYAFSFFSSFPGSIILAHSDSGLGPSKNCSVERGMAALFTRSSDVLLHWCLAMCSCEKSSTVVSTGWPPCWEDWGKMLPVSLLSSGCGAEVAVRRAAVSQGRSRKYLLPTSTASAKLLFKTCGLVPACGEMCSSDLSGMSSKASSSSRRHGENTFSPFKTWGSSICYLLTFLRDQQHLPAGPLSMVCGTTIIFSTESMRDILFCLSRIARHYE